MLSAMPPTEKLRDRLTVTAVVVMAALLVFLIATNPTRADRVDAIGNRIKCPVCQGESIADSPSQMARDMLSLVADRVAEGRSDEEIIDELLSSFSGAVLLDPPASGATLWLWLAPAAAVAAGVVVIVLWRRSAPRDDRVAKRLRAGPAIILAIAFGVIAVIAGFSIQDRAGPAAGAADVAVDDLDDVSNETMEAVIAANPDNPQINGMRLALAERYYEIGDYRSAFPHYLEVAGSPRATDDEAIAALVSLGWMAWEGNGESDAAIGLFDEALTIDDGSVTARYLKGQVLWCGLDDLDGAGALFQQILDDPELPDDTRDRVQDDLDAVHAGVACA